jgi:hypothetical protein
MARQITHPGALEKPNKKTRVADATRVEEEGSLGGGTAKWIVYVFRVANTLLKAEAALRVRSVRLAKCRGSRSER